MVTDASGSSETTAAHAAPHRVTARLAEHLPPVDRAELYEDPLSDFLAERGLGVVAGGGTHLGEDGEIVFADIEIELSASATSDVEAAVAAIAHFLDEAGATAGSYLVHELDGHLRRTRFGSAECVAIFLDGIGLAPIIYDTNDVDELVDRLVARLACGEIGELRGAWAGASTTALVLGGRDAIEIADAVRPVIELHPLCAGARVVVGYRHPSGPFSDDVLTLRS